MNRRAGSTRTMRICPSSSGASCFRPDNPYARASSFAKQRKAAPTMPSPCIWRRPFYRSSTPKAPTWKARSALSNRQTVPAMQSPFHGLCGFRHCADPGTGTRNCAARWCSTAAPQLNDWPNASSNRPNATCSIPSRRSKLKNFRHGSHGTPYRARRIACRWKYP